MQYIGHCKSHGKGHRPRIQIENTSNIVDLDIVYLAQPLYLSFLPGASYNRELDCIICAIPLICSASRDTE